ncbi:hypothetical protein N9B72_01995, partial [Bacteriovoracaceae bacterium]|nr:hypothetical protein [Bacteriovoracaceae bacterium]
MIRETMKFKNIRTLCSALFFIIIFSACVPVEKRTECGVNEAFNANLRVCVPTIGTNSSLLYIDSRLPSNNITTFASSTASQNFSIVVNDVYSNGYIISWNLRDPNNSVTYLSSGSGANSISFQPSSQATQGAGTYQIEASVLDSTNSNVIAATSWTVNLTGAATPEITSITPQTSALSLTINEADTTFSIAYNANGAVVTPKWYINGSEQTASSGTTSLIVAVASLNYGINFINASLTDATGGGSVYESTMWTVIKSYPELSFIMSGGDSANPQTTGLSPDPNIISVGGTPTQVIAIDGVSVPDGGFKSSGSDVSGGTGSAFCIYVSDYTGSRQLSGISNVFVRFKLDGSLLGGNLNFSGDGATNQKCLTDVTGYNTFTVSLSAALQDIGTSKTITAEVCDMGPAGSKTDCSNGYLAYTYTWTLNVRSTNTAPVIGADIAAGSPPATNTTDIDTSNDMVQLTQDQSQTFSMAITDDDSDPNNNNDFQTRWYLNGLLLDGINTYPDSTAVTSDCYHTYNDAAITTPSTEKYSCAVSIPSYLTSGPNSTTSYTLTAVTSDQSIWPGGINKDSNILTWTLNVTEAQSAPVIQPLFDSVALAGGQNANENSYFALQSTPDTPIDVGITALDENTDLVFKIRVKDDERDNYYRLIEMCKTYTVGDPSSTASDCTILSGMQLISRTDDQQYSTTEYALRMPETAITAVASGQVHFRVTVQDIPTNTQGTLDYAVLSVNINNNNPAPTIDITTISPALAPVLPLVS